MNEKVHYEDNLFYILTEIKKVKNGLKLKVDPIYFADSMVRDIKYIDKLLKTHYELLMKNCNLIRRNEFLSLLYKDKRHYVSLIEQVLEKKNFFTYDKDFSTESLKRSMATHLKEMKSIHNEIKNHFSQEEGENHSLSLGEYNLLLDKK